MIFLLLLIKIYCIKSIRIGRLSTALNLNSRRSTRIRPIDNYKIATYDGISEEKFGFGYYKHHVTYNNSTENINMLYVSINDYFFQFENADLYFLDLLRILLWPNNRILDNLVLKDRSEIRYNGRHLVIYLKGTKDVAIYNVLDVTVNDDTLFLTLKYNVKLIIGDSTFYRDDGNGLIIINPSRNKILSEGKCLLNMLK